MNNSYVLNDQILIDLIPDLVFIKDLNGYIIKANKSYLEFINKEIDEVVGKTDFDILSKEDAIAVTKNDQLVITSGETHIFDDTIKKGNNRFYFKTKKSPLYNEKNEIIALFCSAKEITKERQLEIIQKDTTTLLEYIAKEDNLNKTLNKIVELAEAKDLNMQCSILLLDETKKKLHCGAAPSLPEFYNEAVDGIEIGDKVGSCGSAAYNKKRVIVDNIDTHENWASYLELTNKANLHSCWSEPIISSKHDVVGTFAMYSAEHKLPCEFELMLIERYAYLSSIAIEKDNNLKKFLKQEKLIAEQSKLASMGEMIGNISHQWRQPLSVISTSATGMLMQKEFGDLSDEQFEKTCTAINENAQYLSSTIDDFKNFIKNDRQFTQFNLTENINSFLSLVEPSVKRHHIELVLDLDPSIRIKGYSNELVQCFMNIFNNAKDALKNSPHFEKYFFIKSYIEKNLIIIKFIDNAEGIPEDILPRVFEPYFTTKHKSQGTGLGLSMTYNLICEGMNGNITVQNRHFNHNGHFYKGAEFTIALPRV